MTKKLSLLFSVLILSFTAAVFIFAWTEPGSAPPEGNVPAPLNVGSQAQTKAGNLTVGGGGAGYLYVGNRGYYIGDDLSGLDIQTNAPNFYVYDGGWKRLLREGDISVPSLNGWSFGNDYFYDDGEEVIRASDEWLRLNQAGKFANGVYTPGKIRADGGLYVSDDEYFYRNSEDFIRTGDHFQSDASVRAPIFYDSNNTGYYVNPNSNSWLYRIYSYDVRADIMYDRNNTGYYVNPASTSNLNSLRLAGTLRLSWQRIQQSCMSRKCTATCSSGYIVVGGGCEMHGGVAIDNRPEYIGRSLWDRRWVCYGRSWSNEDKVETTYAICLKIQSP